MYMRLVHLQVKPGKRRELREFYERRVMPALAEIPGCLYAILLEGRERADDWLSCTFWPSWDQAEAYEKSGLSERMIRESEEFLERAVDWKVELTRDMSVEGRAEKRRFEVEGYNLGNETPPQQADKMMYVRIVSIKVATDKIDEFRKRYNELVQPQLQEEADCLFAFLSEEMQDSHHMLSVSIWRSEQAAIKFELSGKVEALTRRMRDTFSHDYQWKMALAPSTVTPGSTPDEPEVRGYEIVTGGQL
jgi:quinol monooxygenase YgiN